MEIRVAFVEPVGGHGGMESYDFGLCEALSCSGTMPFLYTCDETAMDMHIKSDIQIKQAYRGIYGRRNRLFRGGRFLKGAFAASRDAKRNLCQVAHFHIFHFSWLEYINMWIFKRKGFRIVATVHDVESFIDPDARVKHRIYRKFQKLIDAVIVHTQFAQSQLQKYFSDYSVEKIHHILPLDFDTLFKTPMFKKEARRILDLPITGRIILFFGQIKEVKGLDILLKAFSMLVESRKDISLVIAGKTWKVDFDPYERFIQQNELSDHVVRRVNYIANEQVPLYFNSADMIVLPYKKIFNSSVLQRALDYGTPVIVSDLEPLAEIIEDGMNGLVFSRGDSEDLAKKILHLVDDEDLCAQLVAGGRRTVVSLYDPAKIGTETKEVYEHALFELQEGTKEGTF